MKNSNLRIVKPQQMNSAQKDDLVSLHQKYITLSKEFILDYLKNRNRMYLYYHKDSKELIATAGVQFLTFGNTLFIYIGNTVVDDRYKHEGCLSHVIMKSLIYSYFRYPFKKKYWCALTSSTGSFSYAQKFQPCWPNVNQDTPPEMTELMEQCIKKIGICEYKIIDRNLITFDLCDKVKKTFHTHPKNTGSANTLFFNKINPGAGRGEQLLFVNQCCIYKLLSAVTISLHHRLIKQPKLYHRLKRKKNSNPFLSTFIVISNLIPRQIKWLGVFVAGIMAYWLV